MTSAHRVTWFAPDRPVDGGTVFVRPDTPETPMTPAEIPDPLNPDPRAVSCTCGAPDVAHCDGCLACPDGAHDEACGW